MRARRWMVCVVSGLWMMSLPLALAQSPAGFSASGQTLRSIYEHLHRNPELAFREGRTAAFLAEEMKALGFEVSERVGDEWVRKRAAEEAGGVEPGVGGYGVVAVLRNGPGPTLMLRTDMDALPVAERTGLSYASEARSARWTGGDEAGVMHACGHDVHMTVWLGTARALVSQKSKWRGTLVMIAQPAEELGLGALAMLEDGLFMEFPRPDYNLALHVNATLPAGRAAYAPGYVMANVDTVDLLVRGRGGHGAYPQDTIDPVVVAARIVGTLQTLVSRELDPQDAGVVTVGAFLGGTTHNVIPDDVRLMITVRSYADASRAKLLRGIERIARAEAAAAGLEGDLAPVMTVKADYTPSTFNDPVLAERVGASLRRSLGEARVEVATPSMVGEDFSRYGRVEPKIPSVMIWLGAVSEADAQAARAAGRTLPALHSSAFRPDPDPAIATGVRLMTDAALDLLKARR